MNTIYGIIWRYHSRLVRQILYPRGEYEPRHAGTLYQRCALAICKRLLHAMAI